MQFWELGLQAVSLRWRWLKKYRKAERQAVQRSNMAADETCNAMAAPGRQGSQVIFESLRSREAEVIGCKCQRSKGARSFRGKKILKPGHRMHFFLQIWLFFFFSRRPQTQAANAADYCFTVKIKQIIRGQIS